MFIQRPSYNEDDVVQVGATGMLPKILNLSSVNIEKKQQLGDIWIMLLSYNTILKVIYLVLSLVFLKSDSPLELKHGHTDYAEKVKNTFIFISFVFYLVMPDLYQLF